MDDLYMLFIIVNNSAEKKITSILNKYKVGFKYVMHGMGTAPKSVLDYFGLNEEEKTIIISILPVVHSKHILKYLTDKVKFNEHGMGVAFSIPLSSSTKYMLDFYKTNNLEDIDMEEVKKHLIVTIVNQGNAEKVMNEAKKAGATGGTTINGRGLETEKIIKFLNIEIEPEKDIVLILADSKVKNDIMNTIVKSCGLKTRGAGICFSLPVDYVAGLHNQSND